MAPSYSVTASNQSYSLFPSDHDKTHEKPGWMNRPMDLQDVFDKALSEYFNEAHKIIFNCSFISRLENGKSVTTSSILSDTVKATNDDMQGIITRAEAAEKEPSLWPIRKARDPLREPAFDIQVAKNKHEQWWKGSVGKSILPDIGKRTAGVLLTFQRMCDGEQVISDEGDLKVLAEEETGKDATDIATSLARILKKQACLTDSVVTDRSLGEAAVTAHMLYSQTADSYTKHVIMKSMFVMAYQDAEAGALLDTLIQWIAGAVNKGHLGSSGVSLRNLAYKGTKTLGEAIKELELYEDDDEWHTKLHDNL